jgi:hypothetical protein
MYWYFGIYKQAFHPPQIQQIEIGASHGYAELRDGGPGVGGRSLRKEPVRKTSFILAAMTALMSLVVTRAAVGTVYRH